MDDIMPIVDTRPPSPPPLDALSPCGGDAPSFRNPDADHETVDSDDLTYRSVPLTVVGRREVVYRYIGPLRPMAYEYDEDAE